MEKSFFLVYALSLDGIRNGWKWEALIMSHDFIGDLMRALNRVITPDISLMKEIIIVSGLPRRTQNLRYLSFNRQEISIEKRILEFSAVAILNNRRATRWRLRGFEKRLSRIIFCPFWTRNPLDLFYNNLRCNPELIRIMDACPSDYTLLGILHAEVKLSIGQPRPKFRTVRPVVAIPDLSSEDLKTVMAFENANEIRKAMHRGLALYGRMRRQSLSH